MPISVECPACEHEFNIPNSYGGKKGKCPECGKIFVAPPADLAGTPRSSRVQPPQPPVVGIERAAPIPPPQQDAGISVGTVVAEPPPAIVLEAPPIAGVPIVSNRESQPPRADKDSGRRDSSPQRPKNTPLWIAVGVLSALLVVSVILVVKNMRLEGKEVAGDSDSKDPKSQAKVEKDTAPSATTKPVKEVPAEVDPPQLALEPMWETARPAVFRIVAKGNGRDVAGLAFAIDERGWLATSYQLIKDAKSVEVVAVSDPSAESVPAKGIVALSPEHNVAIIAIGQSLDTSLTLEAGTLGDNEKLAVCRSSDAGQLGLTQGDFVKLTSFEQLPPDSRTVAQQQGLDRTAGLIWLEHDQPLKPSDSGGPLLNPDGRVVGISTNLSPDSKSGFALPSAYLMELVEAAGGEISPFTQDVTLVATNAKPPVTPNDVGPADVPKPPARIEPGSLESIDMIRELHKACKGINWKPETPEEYELFQELAEYVYVAKVNETDKNIEEGLRILIAAPAQEVLEELSKTEWPEEPDMKRLDALAVLGLDEPGKGIVCFVEIATAAGDTIKVDGGDAILCNLIGTEQSIIVPVKKSLPKLKPKTQWLLIGMHDPSQTFDLRVDDGMQKKVPLVRAKQLVGERKIKPPAKLPASRRGRR